MQFTINLDYTPQCPQPNKPFTETSFTRQAVPHIFSISEIGIALVDLWNIGWDDGPVSEKLGAELSLERGTSHAARQQYHQRWQSTQSCLLQWFTEYGVHIVE